MHQSVGPCIVPVLGQKQPRLVTRDRHECWAAGLEAVSPLFGEAQALIPPDRRNGVGHAQDRNDFGPHAGIVSRPAVREVQQSGAFALKGDHRSGIAKGLCRHWSWHCLTAAIAAAAGPATLAGGARHSGVTWRLNLGVTPAEIAPWAGHSVAMLMRTYARCVTGTEDVWITRMDQTPAPGQSMTWGARGARTVPQWRLVALRDQA